MGAVDMSEFLKHYLKTSPGNVLGENGEIVGRHEGALLYTIGQRHGFTTEKKSANEAPYFVIAKDIAANTVSVAHRDPDDKKGKSTILILKEVNSIAQTGALPESMLVRIRYRGELIAARFVPNAIQGGTLTLGVATEGVATGQSVVFYREAECLGGGVIDHIAQ
jgi:tRNA-specific 2-thiouridylase